LAQEEEPEHTEEGSGSRADDFRESIWSIRVKHKRLYFLLFTLQIIIGTAWLIRKAVLDESLTGISDRALSLWQELAPAAIASAAIALVITDIWGTITVFADWLEETLQRRRRNEQERHRKEIQAAKEFGRMEATAVLQKRTAEVQQRWEGWNHRREAAVAAGVDFNEPPPGIDQDTEDPQQE
jgi:hypothetical protein